MNTQLRRLPPILASIAVGVIPVFILINYFGVPRRLIVGWGVLSYIIGVTAIKMPIYHFFVVKFLHPKLSNVWLSVSHGFVSAVSELGSAFVFFIFVVPNMTLAQLIGFGAAAGAVEAIMLPFIQNPLKGTPLEEHVSAMLQSSSNSTLISWMGVLERVLALVPHVASRGLVYITFSTANIVPALLAVTFFATIDGRAYYAHLTKWAFDDFKVLGRFYRFVAITAVLQALCFAFLYDYLM